MYFLLVQYECTWLCRLYLLAISTADVMAESGTVLRVEYPPAKPAVDLLSLVSKSRNSLVLTILAPGFRKIVGCTALGRQCTRLCSVFLGTAFELTGVCLRSRDPSYDSSYTYSYSRAQKRNLGACHLQHFSARTFHKDDGLAMP